MRHARRWFAVLVGAGVIALASCHGGSSSEGDSKGDPLAAAVTQVSSGGYVLDASATGGVSIRSASTQAVLFAQSQPCQVMVKNGASQTDVATGYASVSTDGTVSTGTCDVRTPSGSVFHFVDQYVSQDATGAFRLNRTVTVTTAAAADQGFGSRFVLGPEQAAAMDSYRFFSPAVWYDHNDYAGSGAIGTDLGDEYFYFRETRAALPVTMMQDAQSGATLALAHSDAPTTTSSGSTTESATDWQVSASFRYASIGAQRVPKPMLAVVYPGTEGNKVYGAPGGTTWRKRSNPIQSGFQQSYAVTIKPGQSSDFAAATRGTWRYFFDLFHPAVTTVSAADVDNAGIALLKAYVKQGSGKGVPFRTALPDGAPVSSDWNYVMGYVGEQIPLGYELLRYGIEHGDAEAPSDGTNILNFWARSSLTPSGLPATWYDEAANGGFRNDPRYWQNPQPVYLRQVSDGMEKMVDAARFMREHGQPQPMWENFCTAVGNWLLRGQNSDGSFYRAYGYDGAAAENTKFNTTHPIRFLAKLYFLTGDAAYLSSAKSAGQYALTNISQPYHYVGGTIDIPTPVIDKEAGVQALHAYLSLYDATKDAAWLSAAGAAADFVETWMYAWNFPIKPLDSTT